MSGRPATELTVEDHQKAFTEVSFLTDIFAATVDDLMGGASTSVGRIAGRHMARKLPIDIVDPTLEQAVGAITHHYRRGFDLAFTCRPGGVDLEVGRCAMREVCGARQLEPGSHVCRLFHHFLDGLVNELCSRPTKSAIVETGDTCRVRMEVR